MFSITQAGRSFIDCRKSKLEVETTLEDVAVIDRGLHEKLHTREVGAMGDKDTYVIP